MIPVAGQKVIEILELFSNLHVYQHDHLAHDMPRRLLVEITYYYLDPSIPQVLQVLKQAKISLIFL